MSKFIEFIRTPKGLFITALIVLVIMVIIYYNGTTIRGWFSSPATTRTMCPQGTYPWRDAQGKLQCSPNNQ